MTVNFEKYQGTGNDFIMIDNRAGLINKNQTELIQRLCDRKFGIGADGLILLQEKMSVDFEMVYFNSDGRESSMCGNGGRCLIKFAKNLGIIATKCTFSAIDGLHEGEILADGNISLKMQDVASIETYHGDYILNTGSPHYVTFKDAVGEMDILEAAKKIRYSTRFEKEGINVNFVEQDSDSDIFVRTYERGVEDETLSCGTGVVASAIAFAVETQYLASPKTQNNKETQDIASLQIQIQTPGGALQVKFERTGDGFRNIYLIGPAEEVFGGKVEV